MLFKVQQICVYSLGVKNLSCTTEQINCTIARGVFGVATPISKMLYLFKTKKLPM